MEEDGRYCQEHAPTKGDKLQRAQRQLEQGKIEQILMSAEAKRREMNFIARFDRQVRDDSHTTDPIDGRSYSVASWDDYHTFQDETGSLLEILGAGYLPKDATGFLPLNLVSRYRLPAPTSGTSRDACQQFVLEARCFSHLRSHLLDGFDTEAVSVRELTRLLHGYIEDAAQNRRICVVGIAATSGWSEEARASISADVEGGSFSHRLVVPLLIDLRDNSVAYDRFDKRVLPFVRLFTPQLEVEAVQKAVAYIRDSLRGLQSSLTPAQIAEDTGVSPEGVLQAFEDLEQSGDFVVDRLSGVGTVIYEKAGGGDMA